MPAIKKKLRDIYSKAKSKIKDKKQPFKVASSNIEDLTPEGKIKPATSKK
jgi:hypothetical protein